MRATRGLRFLPPTPHEPAVLFLLVLVWYGHGMARHGALDHGGHWAWHAQAWAGLAWGVPDPGRFIHAHSKGKVGWAALAGMARTVHRDGAKAGPAFKAGRLGG